MRVVVKLFALLREKAGTDAVSLALPEGARVAQALAALRQQYPELAPYLDTVRPSLRMEFVDEAEPLHEGDEVALIPPVSGGTAMIKVTTEPLDLARIHNAVKRTSDGAVVTFDGIVRDNMDGRPVRYLEYEAYAAMAEKKMAEIVAEARQKFAVGEVAIVHRLGRLEIGESSIVVSVAAPHRQAAFEACAYIMNRVKEDVPIWKKEFFADGEAHWVNQD